MNAISFNLSTQGASHIKKNKECQDNSRSYYDDNIAIAVVCDGHGGDDYMRSAVGSKCACDAAERNIKQFLENIDKDKFFSNPDKLLKDLEASIINVWNQLIFAHLDQNPFTEEELNGVSEKARRRYTENRKVESAYGTTLIVVAMTHEYWFGIHIGDGKCVAVNPEGKFVQPIPWDPKCFLNATTSICDSDALGSFRHFYSEKLPVAVFVGSDGVDDCFSNNDQLHNLYKTILYSFGTSPFQEAVDGLSEYLPRLSAKGSGDDVSISAMMDLDLLPELSIVKEFDREKEKARVEENARLEAEKNEAERRRVEQEHAQFQQRNNRSTKEQQMPKFCTECGSKLASGMKFCSECGAKICPVRGKTNETPQPQQIQLFPIRQYKSDNDINIEDKEDGQVANKNVLNDTLDSEVITETNIEKQLDVTLESNELSKISNVEEESMDEKENANKSENEEDADESINVSDEHAEGKADFEEDDTEKIDVEFSDD